VGLEAGATAITEVVRALDERGVEVIHIELDAPSLDDVFADATGRRLEGAGDIGDVEDPTGPVDAVEST
jgi:ABC-2 type transport system ATP-binding protein